MNPENNRARWLAVIMHAEGTGKNKNPYGVMFGGGTFDNNGIHPNKVIDGSNGMKSAAAGAYQFMPFTWDEVTSQLGLPPNSPMTKENQDKAATHLAKKRGVDIKTAPLTRENLAKLSPEWASLPTLAGKSYYGQPVKSYKELLSVFKGFKSPTFVEKVNTRLDKKHSNVKTKPLVIPEIRKTENHNPFTDLFIKSLQNITNPHSLRIGK